VKSYLLIGRGVPEGETCYVLRKNVDNGELEIWNAIYGEAYFLGVQNIVSEFLCLKFNMGTTINMDKADPACPLKEVACVANHENVWINIQDSNGPSSISYDIINPKLWLPFLGSSKTAAKLFPNGKVPTIQTPLIYEPTNLDYVQKLERKIQSFIANNIVQLRLSNEGGKKPLNTKWNRKMGQNLRNILLTTFESFKYKIRTSGRKSTVEEKNHEYEQAMDELEKIKNEIVSELTGGREIYGFPLNMTYTDMNKIWEEVKNTDIHNILDNDVEFVLAVGVYPYDHYVLSVWVYVAVLFNPLNERT